MKNLIAKVGSDFHLGKRFGLCKEMESVVLGCCLITFYYKRMVQPNLQGQWKGVCPGVVKHHASPEKKLLSKGGGGGGLIYTFFLKGNLECW